MEIKTDTCNKLRKIMNGDSFVDKLTFISECLQNCQRAKAANVCIDIQDNQMSITDDGCGCRNPEAVLTLDLSDWKSTDEGFGIGFMSVFAIPELEKVIIESGNWRINLDIQKIKEGNLNYSVEETTGHVQGFKVTMNSDYFSENACDIESRAVADSQYISNFNTYINGMLVDKKSVLDEYRISQYGISVNCPEYEGILEVSRWGGIKVYYENRFVCESYNLATGVAGIILLKKGKGLLREPDRKEFTRNISYYKLVNTLKKHAHALYVKYVDKFGMEDERYIQSIAYNLSEKEIEERLDLDNIMSDIARVSGYANKKDKNIEMLMMTDIETDAGNVTAETVSVLEQISSTANNVMCNKQTFAEDNSSVSKQYVSKMLVDKEMPGKDAEPKNSKETKKTAPVINSKDVLKTLRRNLKVAFWVKVSEIDNYKSEIAEAEYYGIPVAVSKNALYDSVFKERCPHISNMDCYLRVNFVRKNVGLRNSKEETFISLLSPICAMYGLPVNTFKIANLQNVVVFEKNGRALYRNVNKDGVLGLSNKANASIYLDRKMLRLKAFKIKKGRISIQEYKCLMNAIDTISHELAHFVYGTQDNTLDHFKTQMQIQTEILKKYM